LRAFHQPALCQSLECGAVLEPAIERVVLAAAQIVVDHSPVLSDTTIILFKWPILALVTRECHAIDGNNVAARPLSGVQQPVEPASTVQRNKVIAAADMSAVDEDLRHSGLPPRTANRRRALGRSMRGINLPEYHALACQDADRASTVGAPGLGIDFDLHIGLLGA
jgi:hypothetical protein